MQQYTTHGWFKCKIMLSLSAIPSCLNSLTGGPTESPLSPFLPGIPGRPYIEGRTEKLQYFWLKRFSQTLNRIHWTVSACMIGRKVFEGTETRAFLYLKVNRKEKTTKQLGHFPLWLVREKISMLKNMTHCSANHWQVYSTQWFCVSLDFHVQVQNTFNL